MNGDKKLVGNWDGTSIPALTGIGKMFRLMVTSVSGCSFEGEFFDEELQPLPISDKVAGSATIEFKVEAQSPMGPKQYLFAGILHDRPVEHLRGVIDDQGTTVAVSSEAEEVASWDAVPQNPRETAPADR
jgi:hypothetical protein